MRFVEIYIYIYIRVYVPIPSGRENVERGMVGIRGWDNRLPAPRYLHFRAGYQSPRRQRGLYIQIAHNFRKSP